MSLTIHILPNSVISSFSSSTFPNQFFKSPVKYSGQNLWFSRYTLLNKALRCTKSLVPPNTELNKPIQYPLFSAAIEGWLYNPRRLFKQRRQRQSNTSILIIMIWYKLPMFCERNIFSKVGNFWLSKISPCYSKIPLNCILIHQMLIKSTINNPNRSIFRLFSSSYVRHWRILFKSSTISQ